MTDYGFLAGGLSPYGVEVINLTTGAPAGFRKAGVWSGHGSQIVGACRVNHAGTKLYVTNQYARNLTGIPGALGVFNLPALTFSHWINLSAVCTDAVGITIDSSDTYAYVTGETTGTLTKVDLASSSIVGNCAAGNGPGSCIDPTGTYAYVMDAAAGTGVRQIDVSTMTVVAHRTVGAVQATAIAMSPSGNGIWFYGFGGFAHIALPAFSAFTFWAIPGAPDMSYFPGAITLNHAGTMAYALEGLTDSVWYFDTIAHVLGGPVSTGYIGMTDMAITAGDTESLIPNQTAPYANLMDLSTYSNAPHLTIPNTVSFGADIGPYTPSAHGGNAIVMMPGLG